MSDNSRLVVVVEPLLDDSLSDPQSCYGAKYVLTSAAVGRYIREVEVPPTARYLSAKSQRAMAACLERRARFLTEERVIDWENGLRGVVQAATPSAHDQRLRLALLDRLNGIVSEGFMRCTGLTIEPYGSFVSGLYTPQGDIDLSIQGRIRLNPHPKKNPPKALLSMNGKHVAQLSRFQTVKILRILSEHIKSNGIAPHVLSILRETVRVPIIKFTYSDTVECDVSCNGRTALFKSTFLGLLAHYDWRCGALVRLVKTFARRFKCNDAANGTFNSYCLTLMVVFFLQTRTPAVLPPLKELFLPGDPHLSRPLQNGAPVTEQTWEALRGASRRLAALAEKKKNPHNPPSDLNVETLFELLSGFFALYACVFSEWSGRKAKNLEHTALAHVVRGASRIDTWNGVFSSREPWAKAYQFSIEDPFDTTDNCARSVFGQKVEMVVDAFVCADSIMNYGLSKGDQTPGVRDRLVRLFGQDMVKRKGAHEEKVQKNADDDKTSLSSTTTAVLMDAIPPVPLILPRWMMHEDAPVVSVLPAQVTVPHGHPRGGGGDGDGGGGFFRVEEQGGFVQPLQQGPLEKEEHSVEDEWVYTALAEEIAQAKEKLIKQEQMRLEWEEEKKRRREEKKLRKLERKKESRHETPRNQEEGKKDDSEEVPSSSLSKRQDRTLTDKRKKKMDAKVDRKKRDKAHFSTALKKKDQDGEELLLKEQLRKKVWIQKREKQMRERQNRAVMQDTERQLFLLALQHAEASARGTDHLPT